MPEVYPEKIIERIEAAAYGGEADHANASGGAANFECGSAIKVSLNIDSGNVICDAKFQTNGCGYSVAAADVLAEYLLDIDLAELHGFDGETIKEILRAKLGEFSHERSRCFEMAAEAFRSALADHRSRLLDEFIGEKALICTCFGVSEEKIESIVAALETPDLTSVAAACNAGSGCGSCRMIIEEIIDQHKNAIE